ncbi:MAG: hypothetical protein II956_06710, partial [Bacteroidales bacterium]|nr:hypothetical protein [Bacteroidales bacterium]
SHVIKGIEIVCVELPKFKAENYAHRKMLKLWQEFLTSINAKTGEENISEAMLENAEVKEALDLCLDLTEEERGYYDGFWGMEFLRNDRDKTVREQGRAEGAKAQSFEIARKMKLHGDEIDYIMLVTGLTSDEISKL